MKLRQGTTAKTKLSGTLRGWLPFLQVDIESLKETLDNATKENPFVQIKSGNEIVQNGKKQKAKPNKIINWVLLCLIVDYKMKKKLVKK